MLNFKKNNFKIDLAIIFLLLLVSAALRIKDLSTIPPGIYGDEAEFGLINNKILNGEYENLFTIADTGIFSFPIISFLPQAWIYNLLGRTIFSLRLSSAFIGAVSVVPFYFLVKEFLDRRSAFISSLFMATSSLMISYSRLAVNNIYPPFLLVLTFYFLFKGIKKHQKKIFIFSGLIMGIGLYSYHPFKIVPLIILFSFLIKSLSREFRKKYFFSFILLFATAFISFLPQIIYYSSHLSDLLARPRTILIFKTFNFSEIYGSKEVFFSNVVKNILVFPFGKDDGYFLYGITKYGLLSPLVILFMLVGIFQAAKKIKDYRWQLVFEGIILTVLATSATVACPASHRLLIATPLVFLVSGYGLGFILNYLPKSLVLLVAALILISNSYWDYFVYFKYYINSTDGWAQREPATQVAYYLKSLGSSYYTYMLRENTVLYFNHGTVKLLNPGIEGEDVDDSSQVIPLKTVKKRNIVFIMPPNSPSLKNLKKYYPNGNTKNFINPRDKQPWFSSFEVSFN